VTEALGSLEPRGTTNVRAGLRAAEEMLDSVDARIKHVILLTDGWGSGGAPTDIVARMQEKGMTLSVVAAGGGSAGYLEQLAELGGGRFYPTLDMSDVPQIFVQETITTVGNYIVERPLSPIAVVGSPLLAGLPPLPQLYGFNGSTLKETARLALLADDQSPLLATWQYGLGRSAAWLSDTSPKWAVDLVTWPSFPRFASQLVGWVLPTGGGQQLSAELAVRGSLTDVRVSFAESSTSQADTALSATLFIGDGAQVVVNLHEVAPGIFGGQLASPAPGTYLVQISGGAGDQPPIQQIAGLVVPYSPEYGPQRSNAALLAELARLTGGTSLSDSAAAFAPAGQPVSRAVEIGLPLLVCALLLLPLDIALRRVTVRIRR
jgi:hypothetical protein